MHTDSTNGNPAPHTPTEHRPRKNAAKRPARRARMVITLDQQRQTHPGVYSQNALIANTPPKPSRALSPQHYRAALKALAECARIDKCKAASDECLVLGIYARRVKDHALRIMAARIYAYAMRRCGELLMKVPSAQGRKNCRGGLPDGTVTRKQAARDAGLSERQMVTALRITNIPLARFNALVESASPPSITRLAELGRKAGPPRSNAVRPNALTPARARKVFRSVQEFCRKTEPGDLARAFTSQDAPALRQFDPTLRRWLDSLMAHLPAIG